MNRYYYDLHIHSCLSPCGDNDMTPNNIAGVCALAGLQIAALTDHNSVKNCPAFYKAAKKQGIIPVAGMELTTAEEIHVVCLFERLEEAMAFGEEVDTYRIRIPNRVDIFGDQLILDGSDEVIGTEEHLLPNATTISLDEVPELVKRFDGVCFPAHIDRDANGIVAILGTVPTSPDFRCVEIHDAERIPEYKEKYGLSDKLFIVSSDSHYLTDIDQTNNFFELDTDSGSDTDVRKALFKHLMGI
jgi:hypothetical protein